MTCLVVCLCALTPKCSNHLRDIVAHDRKGHIMSKPLPTDSMTKRHPVITRGLLMAACAAGAVYVIWSLLYK